MSLANLFNVPKTEAELLSWATAHASNHRDINRRIFELGGVALPEYVLEPINPDNMGTWAYQHQIMHNQMNALLNIKGFNLTNPDFKNLAALPDWIQLNANEHVQANDALGIGTSGDLPPPPPQVATSVFEDNAQSAAGGASYTFPGMSFGTPAANRYIVVCVAWRGPFASGLTVGTTIGGVTAGLVVTTGVPSTGVSAAIIIAPVPTGTAGDVVINLNAASPICTVAVYSLTGIASPAAAVIATRVATSNPTLAASLDVAENGTVIAVATNIAGAFFPSSTWTNLTEDCDNSYPAGSGNLGSRSSASRNFTAQQFGVNCRCVFTTTTGSAAAFAVFNP